MIGAQNIDLREVLIGQAARLRYIIRFSTCRVAHPESVAEHSYYVALYTALICQWYRADSETIAWAMTYAVFHDLEEARSGDFPRPFKHSTPELKASLNVAAKSAMEQVVHGWSTEPIDRKNWVAVWEYSKTNDVAGSIVAFADFLSALSYLAQENMDRNHSVIEHTAAMRAYYEEFQQERFDFIRPLVVQAGQLMKEIFDAP